MEQDAQDEIQNKDLHGEQEIVVVNLITKCCYHRIDKDFKVYDVPLTCPATWSLIQSGRTLCGFQIESKLLQVWAQECQPKNIQELADLIALVRPGVLNSRAEDGISMAKHYAMRKRGEEQVSYIHPSLQNILKDTQGILLYQEQIVEISSQLAGFTLNEAMGLLKGLAKKLPEVVSEYKNKFIEGCNNTKIVNDKIATLLFDNIEKSNRYLFNKSHGISYSHNAYYSMWLKAHFPLETYLSWLHFAYEKQDPKQEIRRLVSDAKLMEINVNGPDLRDKEVHFYIKNGGIRFGLSDVKGIGVAAVTKIKNKLSETETKLKKPLPQWTFYEWLTQYSDKISSNVAEALITSGATGYMQMSRSNALFQYKKWNLLTDKEKEKVKIDAAKWNNLLDAIKNNFSVKKMGGAAANKNREIILLDIIKSLENPPTTLKDDNNWLCNEEIRLLGTNVSVDRIKNSTSMANIKCKDILNGANTKGMILAVEIIECKVHQVKNGPSKGENMAFLKVEDDSGILENVIVFSSKYQDNQEYLTEGNTVIIHGWLDKKRKDTSFIVNMIEQL
jgi:DNA polymerase-3 subunit alpha